MPGLLEGRSALVTGGMTGIGRAVTELFLVEGASVTLLDHSDVSELPDGATLVQGDVREPEANRAAVAAAAGRHGELDIFVGNAGIHDGGRGIFDIDGETLRALAMDVLTVNLLGFILGAHAAAPALTAASGCMILTLSDAAYVVGVNKAGISYAASKHGGLGLVRALASELAPRVRVNGVAPGGVPTALRNAPAISSSHDPRGDSHFTDEGNLEVAVTAVSPLKTMLRAEEVAHAYLFLAASPASRGMTGQVLRLDGGLGLFGT
ncbi:MAG: SDR family oxidoreductase [Candidatus Dormibacteraeota bacterium]|nr:SDR family oxidoreductase [Candidatus Dormibacteraeota bacterium]